jgi:hypothetical protein
MKKATRNMASVQRPTENAIKTVRYFMATTDLLTDAEVHVLARRCDNLERIVLVVKSAK